MTARVDDETLGEMKPCPFCGSAAKLIRPMGERVFNRDASGKTIPPYYGPNWFRVICSADYGVCQCSVAARPSEAEAVAAWNRRPLEVQEARARPLGELDEDDLASDDRWNAGVNYAIERLCEILAVDPKSISWDAATETVNGDVMSVICNALVAAYGDEWSGNACETAIIRSVLTHPQDHKPREVDDAMVDRGLEEYSEGGCMGLDQRERREVVTNILTAALSLKEPSHE